MQVTAGVTGAINFSGAAVGGGGPYWGAELAAATSTNSEIMAGFDWIGLRERVADGFKERLPLWRETRTCGILRKPRADLLLLIDFHILPRAPTQSGTPRTAEECVIFFSQSGSMGKNVSDKGT